MESITSTPRAGNPASPEPVSRPQVFKVPFRDTHLWLVIDDLGVRWVPVAHIVRLLALPLGDMLTRLDENPAEYRHTRLDVPPALVGGSAVCLRTEYLHSLLWSGIKDKRVSQAYLPMLLHLRAEACDALNSFQPEPMILMETVPVIEGEIVTLNEGVPVTTTLAIAKGMGYDHASVIKLTRTYVEQLQKFNPVRFEIRPGKPLPQGGFGASTEYALLNQPQSALLISLMRNNEQVVDFKVRLIQAFVEVEKRAKFLGPQAEQLLLQTAEAVHDMQAVIATLGKKPRSTPRPRKPAAHKRIPGAELERWEKYWGPYVAASLAHKADPDFYPAPVGAPPQQVIVTSLGYEH